MRNRPENLSLRQIINHDSDRLSTMTYMKKIAIVFMLMLSALNSDIMAQQKIIQTAGLDAKPRMDVEGNVSLLHRRT